MPLVAHWASWRRIGGPFLVLLTLGTLASALAHAEEPDPPDALGRLQLSDPLSGGCGDQGTLDRVDPTQDWGWGTGPRPARLQTDRSAFTPTVFTAGANVWIVESS